MKHRSFFSSVALLFLTMVTPSLSAERQSVALVLSGGGALGFAHIPVLELIEELDIPIDMVIGTSAGSIIGGLYCAGYTPEEIEKSLAYQDWSKIFQDGTTTPFERTLNEHSLNSTPISIKFSDGMSLDMGTGLLTGQKAYELFEKLTVKLPTNIDFDSLPIPFRAVTVNLFSGEQVVLSSGSVAEAIRASMSIPSFFEPFCIDGQYYIDGMAQNNIAIDVAKQMGFDIIIAVELSPELEDEYEAFQQNPLLVLKQMMDMGISLKGKANYNLADIVICPDYGNFSEIDYLHAIDIYNTSKKTIDKYKDGLLNLRNRIYTNNDIQQIENHQAHHVYSNMPDNFVTSLSVLGATARDEKFINKTFNSLIANRPLTPELLATFLDKLYMTGNYSTVVPRLTPVSSNGNSDSNTVSMELILTQKKSDKAIVLVNASLDGTMALDSTTSLNASTDMQIRELTGKGSVLSAKLTFINDVCFKLTYIQPFGPKAFARLSCQYLNDRTLTGAGWTYAPISAYMQRSREAELTFGFPFSTSHTLLAGAGIKYFDTTEQTIDGAKSFAGDFMTSYTFSSLNHIAFPTSGAYVSVKGQGVLPITEHTKTVIFETVNVDATGVIPLGSYVSLVLNGFAGLNISQRMRYVPSLMSVYGYNTADRRFFPQISADMDYGLHKIVFGGAVQVSPWKQITLLGGQAFFSVSGAVGKVWQNFETMNLKNLTWRASCDSGLRITDELSVILRVGAGTTCGKVRPFVSLDVGCLRN